MSATPAAPAAADLKPSTAAVHLALSAIVPSPTNPRTIFDKELLKELADSIKEQGVMQPVLVRPLDMSKSKPGAAQKYELVAGERRFRASKLAGVPDIPAMVRELTDKQAAELQCIENAQREDLTPLEEGDGYARLIKEHGYMAATLAAKIGKSKAHVERRVRAAALPKPCRDLLAAGKLNIETSMLVTRIPVEKLQIEAAKQITERYPGASPMSFREASQHVRQHFMLDLSSAPFPTGDAELVPTCGACTVCSKRTGNQPELFADVLSQQHHGRGSLKDLCTDPVCFDAKRTAYSARLKSEAEARGQIVISGAAAKKIKPSEYTHGLNEGWAALTDHCQDDPEYRTYKQIVGKDTGKIVLLHDPFTEQMVEIIKKQDARDLLKSRGVKVRTSTSGNGPSMSAQQREAQRKATLETSVRGAILDGFRTKRGPSAFDRQDLELLARALVHHVGFDNNNLLSQRWGYAEEFKKRHGSDDIASPVIAKLSQADLCRFILEASVISHVKVHSYSSFPYGKTELAALAKRYKVDDAKIRSTLEKEARDKIKAKTKKKTVLKSAKDKAKVKATAARKQPAGHASFMKPLQPSEQLAAVIGAGPMPRTDITKKLWGYIKKHGLNDKKNKRMINADDKLKKVFGGKAQVSMFEMTKLVNKHLRETPAEGKGAKAKP